MPRHIFGFCSTDLAGSAGVAGERVNNRDPQNNYFKKMKRFILILEIILLSIQAFPQDKFGILVRCGGQADFGSLANCGFSFGVAGSGVLHVGIVDISLGLGYSYKLCSQERSLVWYQEETLNIRHRMNFLNVPFAVSVQCWRQGKFRLKIHNELEYSRLFCHTAFLKENRQAKTIEKWGDVPREAANGLFYRLGLTATYDISEHCILSLTPFFGVKAILNQYKPTPTHPPIEQRSSLPDHRFSSGVLVGMEYRF